MSVDIESDPRTRVGGRSDAPQYPSTSPTSGAAAVVVVVVVVASAAAMSFSFLSGAFRGMEEEKEEEVGRGNTDIHAVGRGDMHVDRNVAPSTRRCPSASASAAADDDDDDDDGTGFHETYSSFQLFIALAPVPDLPFGIRHLPLSYIASAGGGGRRRPPNLRDHYFFFRDPLFSFVCVEELKGRNSHTCCRQL
jgi:hypothetical protein